jgi:hypothetical protein
VGDAGPNQDGGLVLSRLTGQPYCTCDVPQKEEARPAGIGPGFLPSRNSRAATAMGSAGCCRAPNQCSSAQLVPARSRAFFFWRTHWTVNASVRTAPTLSLAGKSTAPTGAARGLEKAPGHFRYRGGRNRQISLSHPIEPTKEFKPTLAISDFRPPVIDLVGTDLLSDVVATETERLKPVPASAYKHLKLEQVNAGTWKVVDPNMRTDVPAKLGHWAGYRTTKPLAWVVDLGYGQWMARCGNEVCNPTNLAEAKRQALAMAVGGMGDYQVSDPIAHLNRLTARLIAKLEKEVEGDRNQHNDESED